MPWRTFTCQTCNELFSAQVHDGLSPGKRVGKFCSKPCVKRGQARSDVHDYMSEEDEGKMFDRFVVAFKEMLTFDELEERFGKRWEKFYRRLTNDVKNEVRAMKKVNGSHNRGKAPEPMNGVAGLRFGNWGWSGA